MITLDSNTDPSGIIEDIGSIDGEQIISSTGQLQLLQPPQTIHFRHFRQLMEKPVVNLGLFVEIRIIRSFSSCCTTLIVEIFQIYEKDCCPDYGERMKTKTLPQYLRNLAFMTGFMLLSSFAVSNAYAFHPQEANDLTQPSDTALQKQRQLIESVLDAELEFHVDPTRSRILRTRLPVSRIAITNPAFVDVNEFNPNEIEIIGLQAGETTVSIWFQTPNGTETVIRYLVKVGADETIQEQADVEFDKLQSRINELFPNSFVQLIPIADKLIVRGQARDSKEAAEILALVTGQSVDQNGNMAGGLVNIGTVANIIGLQTATATKVINMLKVSGEQQVMLKVRIAELNRNASRELGMDFRVFGDNFAFSSLFGVGGNLTAILDGGDVQLFLKAFSSNGMGKILAEPTLVTLSGQPATFIAGGEFAVPTTVGIDGVGAVSTTFQGFGTQLMFTPTVVDKDRIRLQVAPSVSDVNQDISVDGIPGLDVRATTTTVDLREGQWLAIAGLIQDEQGSSRARVPFIGDVPILGLMFGNQKYERTETELVIMVSPELVHPLEPEQVPLFLPGMEVTEPSPKEFWIHQQIEGLPNDNFRSTVWPAYRHQLHHGYYGSSGEGTQIRLGDSYQDCEDYYMGGVHGFTK